MVTWMEECRSLAALGLVTAAVAQRGTRGDLAALRIVEGMPEREALLMIADTQFAVFRRSVR